MVSSHLWAYLKLQRHDKRRERTERFGTDASAEEVKQVGIAGRNVNALFFFLGLPIKKNCVQVLG